jgi:apolipoprotein N-acyltransferase
MPGASHQDFPGEKGNHTMSRPHSAQVSFQRDRLSYLWLALGILFFAFATVRWTIPLAAWLYPVFLLRFVRTQPLLRGILLVLLASVLELAIELQGFVAFSGALYYLAPFGFGVVFGVLFTLPYLIDRVVAPRLGGMLGTLVFPLAVTTVWYLNDLVNPFPWGNPAYTQYGNLPLLQLLSVTGLWGIVFLMSWLASLVNWAWEQGFAWSKVRPGLLLYSGLLALVFVGGGARLAFFAPQGPTVRVAGITASRALPLPDRPFLDTERGALFLSGKATEADRQPIRPVLAQIDDDLLTRSQQEARAGAKVVVWSESDAVVLQEDEAALLQQARAVAQASGIYLDMGLAVILPPSEKPPFAQESSVLIDPTGKVVWIYQKQPIAGLETTFLAPGDGHLPTIDTPYGRLATAICSDTDIPGTVLQAGQANVDLLLRPCVDGRGLDPIHTQMATFRAIENGFSLVTQADEGLSMAVDYEGNVLAASDYFTTDAQVMVAYVPMQGVHTIYATIGDLFAWLSVAGLVVLIGFALARRPKAGETGAAEPRGEPLPVS